MATATASASDDVPVPDSDEERPPGFSPAASRNEADFESFLRFMRNRQPPGRGRRDDSDDDGRSDDRTNAGPPPSWDGASGFKDYLIRARLWLATTKTKAKARGPLLLKNLTGVPFDSMKYLAKDDSWLRSDDNAEQMLKLMDTKELFGDDDREDMLSSLVKITYGLRRGKGEEHQTFFTKWDNAVRKLDEHAIKLPDDYLGFLLTMALKLSSDEVKLLLNFTQGKLGPKAVKEWIRVHETNLDLTRSSSTSNQDKKTNSLLLAEDGDLDSIDEYPNDDENLEILLNAMGDLDDDDGKIEDESSQVFDEDEVKEVLSAMVRNHGKGGGKRTFSAVHQAKKSKELARGYGSGRLAGRRFQGNDQAASSSASASSLVPTGSYRVSIETLKRRTRRGHCKQVGHWHKECPLKLAKPDGRDKSSWQNHYLEDSNEALFLHYLDWKATWQAPSSSTASSSSNRPAAADSNQRAAYMDSALHECWYVQGHVDDASCGTIDTGCQRSAIGSETLAKLVGRQPPGLGVSFVPESRQFKSVNGISRTNKVACLATSLGPKGCILRPAVFEDPHGRHAPLLLSLPFLLHCRAVLHLDPDEGLCLHLKKFNQRVPFLIGPTGALRVPLHQFQGGMLEELTQALRHIDREQANEVMSSEADCVLRPEPKPDSSSSHCELNLSSTPRPLHEAQPHDGDQDQSRVEATGDQDAHVDGSFLQRARSQVHGNQDGLRDPGRQPLRAHGQECRDGQGDDHGRPLPNESTGFSSGDAPLRDQHGLLHRDPERDGHAGGSEVLLQQAHGDSPDSEGRKQLPADVLLLPQVQEASAPMQLLPMDTCPAVLEEASAVPERLQRLHGAGEVPAMRLGAGPKGKRVHFEPDLPGEYDLYTGTSTSSSCSPACQEDSGKQLDSHNLDGGGSGLPGVDGVQRVPGVPQAQSQAEPVDRHSVGLCNLPPARARRIVASLQRSEQLWAELAKALGPNASDYLPVLKNRVLEDLQKPTKQKLAYYQEVFSMSSKQLRTVAEVFCPNRFVPRAHRHGLQGGKAFDIVLGDDLSLPGPQAAVLSYIRHHRPGLCVVCPPCGTFSTLQYLKQSFREHDIAAMKRFVQKLKAGSCLSIHGRQHRGDNSVFSICAGNLVSTLFEGINAGSD